MFDELYLTMAEFVDISENLNSEAYDTFLSVMSEHELSDEYENVDLDWSIFDIDSTENCNDMILNSPCGNTSDAQKKENSLENCLDTIISVDIFSTGSTETCKIADNSSGDGNNGNVRNVEKVSNEYFHEYLNHLNNLQNKDMLYVDN